MDDSDSPEGGIDPLGLFAIADALGERLAPGVRERMSAVTLIWEKVQ